VSQTPVDSDPAVTCQELFQQETWVVTISLDMFAVEGDGRLARSEGIGDEAGKDMDHGVHDGPVA
jgi:hypothetical protein